MHGPGKAVTVEHVTTDDLSCRRRSGLQKLWASGQTTQWIGRVFQDFQESTANIPCGSCEEDTR